MKMVRWLVFFVMGIILVGAVHSSVQAQEIPQEPDDIIQIILVLDVSSSMDEPILTGDMPEELLALVDQLATVREDEELLQIEQTIETILIDPDVVNARTSYLATVDALDEWFSENYATPSQTLIMQQVEQALLALGCSPTYDQAITSALTIDEVDYWISQSCSGMTVNYEDRQTLRDLVSYIGEAEYTSLQETSDASFQVFFDALEERNYNKLIEQRDQKRLDLNIDALAADLDSMIAELGIPRKLDLAKLAAKTLIDLSRLDSVAGRRDSLLGLVRFSTDSVLLQGLSADHEAINRKIDALEPLEMTNIYGGLDEALRELNRNANSEMPIVILLLSDGHITTGPGPDQVLREIPLQANEMDAVICTVGFGATEAHVDFELLATLASKTDGEYLFAKSGEELVNFFVACRQGMVGEVAQITGYVNANASQEVDSQMVPANTCELSLALNSTTGEPVLDILDPQGNLIGEETPNFLFQSGDNLKLYTVLNPKDGEWHVSVRSESTGVEETFFSIVVTTHQCLMPPTPAVSPTAYLTHTPVPGPDFVAQATPILPLVLVVLVALGIFIAFTLRHE